MKFGFCNLKHWIQWNHKKNYNCYFSPEPESPRRMTRGLRVKRACPWLYIKKSLLKTFFKPNFWKKSKLYFQSSAKKCIYANIFPKKWLRIFFWCEFIKKFCFLKIYEMGSTQGDFLDIAHVKVDNFAVLEMYIKARLEKFVWSTLFVQCESY